MAYSKFSHNSRVLRSAAKTQITIVIEATFDQALEESLVSVARLPTRQHVARKTALCTSSETEWDAVGGDLVVTKTSEVR